jgi:hypothetical protein
MEFRVKLAGALPDPDLLDALLAQEDPAACSELDGAARVWRVSTLLTSQHLVDLLADAGCPTSPWHVSLVPSVCCGGCSG